MEGDPSSLEEHVHPRVILLVEDNPNDVLLMQRAFRKANLRHELQVVRDGVEAIAYLAGDGSYSDRNLFPFPDLVLLDLKLPRKNGLEVLAWIRERTDLRRFSVVVLTSSHLSDDIKRAYDLGANSYLVKPIEFDSLVGVVKMLDLYWFMLNESPPTS